MKAAERHVSTHGFGFMLCCRFLPEVNPLAAAIAGAARVALLATGVIASAVFAVKRWRRARSFAWAD